MDMDDVLEGEKSRWIGDKSVKEGENKGRVKDDAKVSGVGERKR